MEPDSTWLAVLLVLASGGLIFGTARLRPIAARIACGVFAVAFGMTAGMAVVNDVFGYYRSWSALRADLAGDYSPFTKLKASQLGNFPAKHGQLLTVTLPGPLSGISRSGLVYLPPQYDDPQYAQVRFPVVELIHGTPGDARRWVVNLNIVNTMDELISRHVVGPMVLVMPNSNSGNTPEECVNGPRGNDDTYISSDVPNDVIGKYRVSDDRSQWGIGGYSSGGYCAANLALRHRTDYGAAGVLDGYFRPGDGEAAGALKNNPAAEAANNPLAAAQALKPADPGPLPAFWVFAGTGYRLDIIGAREFVAALRRVATVPLIVDQGVSHNFYAWNTVMPHMLVWMWQQLASPGQRREFPVNSGGQGEVYVGHGHDDVYPSPTTSPPVPKSSSSNPSSLHPSHSSGASSSPHS